MLILSLSLALALIYPVHIAPHLPVMPIYAATTEYVNPPLEAEIDPLEAKITAKTLEIYAALEPVNKERARQEAIRQLSEELLSMTYDSPHVDYDALKAEYGY